MKVDILIIKLFSTQSIDNIDMLKLTSLNHRRLLLRILILIVLLILIPKTQQAQIVLGKETIQNNYYKLECSLDMSRIKVSEMPGENIISYQGFVDPSKPGEIAFPSFDVFVAIPANTKPIAELISEESQSVNAFPELNPSISIINSQTNYAKQIELRNYDLHNLLINKGFLWIENNYCMHLKLNLFQLTPDGNGINIINKFIIQLRFSSNLSETKSSPQKKMSPAIFNKTFALNNISRISAKLSDSGSWIDYNSEYVKIGTNKDAVYRIGYDDLIVSGVNLTSIDPRTFKIFLKGKEIPIYVNGEADGIFNGGDFIEFVGLRNMGGNYREVSSIGEPYKEYVNRYSDTTIYWLTWNGNSGLRANPLTYNAIPQTQ